jgi:hypothetical protein
MDQHHHQKGHIMKIAALTVLAALAVMAALGAGMAGMLIGTLI